MIDENIDYKPIVDNFFKERINLNPKEYSFRVSKKGNVLIENKKNKGITYILLKNHGYREQEPSFLSKETKLQKRIETFYVPIQEALETMYPDFVSNDYEVRPVNKQEFNVFKKGQKKRSFCFYSDGRILAWANNFPYPAFSEESCNIIKNNLLDLVNKNSKDYCFIENVIATNLEDGKISVSFIPFESTGIKKINKLYQRESIFEQDDIARISQILPSNFSLSNDKKEEIIEKLKNLRNEYINKYPNEKILEIQAIKEIRKNFQKYFTPWFFDSTSNSRYFAISKINGTNVLFQHYSHTFIYDFKTDSLKESSDDLSKVKGFDMLFNFYPEIAKITSLLSKNYYVSSLSLEDGCLKGNLNGISYSMPFSISLRKNVKYETIAKEKQKEFAKFIKDSEKKKYKKISEIPHFGSFAAVAVLKFVEKNEDYITPNAVAKALRGLTTSFGIKDTDDSRKHRLSIISLDAVKEIIDTLVLNKVLQYKTISGDYGKYYIIKKGSLFNDFLNFSQEINPKIKKKSFEGETEYQVKWMLKNIDYSSSSPALVGKNFIYISEHPCLYAYAEEDIKKFSENVSEKYKEFVRMTAEFNDIPSMKKYQKMLGKM